MAIVHNNPVVNGLSGALGNLVFRQFQGKTILASKGSSPRKQSEQQRLNRAKFKDAAIWAKTVLILSDRRAYYTHKAKKLKLPNAYTAAVCDYMRKGEIKEIDTHQYKGKAGDVIQVKIHKKDFTVQEARVSLHYTDGSLIELGKLQKKNHDVFIYNVKQGLDEKIEVIIRVTLCEHSLNRVIQEVVLTI